MNNTKEAIIDNERVEFRTIDLVIGSVAAILLVIGVAEAAQYFSAAQEVTNAATQAYRLIELQQLIAQGGADCHVTIGGTLHHIGAMIQDGSSTLFHMVGQHLVGAPDALDMVQSSPHAIEHFLSDPADLSDIVSQIQAQGDACLR